MPLLRVRSQHCMHVVQSTVCISATDRVQPVAAPLQQCMLPRGNTEGQIPEEMQVIRIGAWSQAKEARNEKTTWVPRSISASPVATDATTESCLSTTL